jgi:hypothetical protein
MALNPLVARSVSAMLTSPAASVVKHAVALLAGLAATAPTALARNRGLVECLCAVASGAKSLPSGEELVSDALASDEERAQAGNTVSAMLLNEDIGKANHVCIALLALACPEASRPLLARVIRHLGSAEGVTDRVLIAEGIAGAFSTSALPELRAAAGAMVARAALAASDKHALLAEGILAPLAALTRAPPQDVDALLSCARAAAVLASDQRNHLGLAASGVTPGVLALRERTRNREVRSECDQAVENLGLDQALLAVAADLSAAAGTHGPLVYALQSPLADVRADAVAYFKARVLGPAMEGDDLAGSVVAPGPTRDLVVFVDGLLLGALAAPVAPQLGLGTVEALELCLSRRSLADRIIIPGFLDSVFAAATALVLHRQPAAREPSQSPSPRKKGSTAAAPPAAGGGPAQQQLTVRPADEVLERVLEIAAAVMAIDEARGREVDGALPLKRIAGLFATRATGPRRVICRILAHFAPDHLETVLAYGLFEGALAIAGESATLPDKELSRHLVTVMDVVLTSRGVPAQFSRACFATLPFLLRMARDEEQATRTEAMRVCAVLATHAGPELKPTFVTQGVIGLLILYGAQAAATTTAASSNTEGENVDAAAAAAAAVAQSVTEVQWVVCNALLNLSDAIADRTLVGAVTEVLASLSRSDEPRVALLAIRTMEGLLGRPANREVFVKVPEALERLAELGDAPDSTMVECVIRVVLALVEDDTHAEALARHPGLVRAMMRWGSSPKTSFSQASILSLVTLTSSAACHQGLAAVGVVGQLLKALDDPSASMQRLALTGLHRMAQTAAPFLPAATPRLTVLSLSQDPALSSHALYLLSLTSPTDPNTLLALASTESTQAQAIRSIEGLLTVNKAGPDAATLESVLEAVYVMKDATGEAVVPALARVLLAMSADRQTQSKMVRLGLIDTLLAYLALGGSPALDALRAIWNLVQMGSDSGRREVWKGAAKIAKVLRRSKDQLQSEAVSIALAILGSLVDTGSSEDMERLQGDGVLAGLRAFVETFSGEPVFKPTSSLAETSASSGHSPKKQPAVPATAAAAAASSSSAPTFSSYSTKNHFVVPPVVLPAPAEAAALVLCTVTHMAAIGLRMTMAREGVLTLLMDLAVRKEDSDLRATVTAAACTLADHVEEPGLVSMAFRGLVVVGASERADTAARAAMGLIALLGDERHASHVFQARYLLDHLVRMLGSSDADVVRAATACLARLCHGVNGAETVLSSGAVAALLGTAGLDYMDVQSNVAHTLALLSELEEGRSELRRRECLPALLALCSSRIPAARTYAAATLNNLAQKGARISLPASLPGLKDLVASLSSRDPALQAASAKAVEVLSRTPSNLPFLLQAQLLQALQALVRSSQPAVLTSAGTLLANMLPFDGNLRGGGQHGGQHGGAKPSQPATEGGFDYSGYVSQLLQTSEYVEAVFRLLECPLPDIRRAAAELVANRTAAGYLAVRSRLVDLGLVSVLLGLCGSPDAGTVAPALEVIAGLAESGLRGLSQTGLTSSLPGLLFHHERTIRANAARVLTAISQDPALFPDLLEHGAVQALVKTCAEGEREVVESSLVAVANIAANATRYAKSAVVAAGVLGPLTVLSMMRDPVFQRKAVAAIGNLVLYIVGNDGTDGPAGTLTLWGDSLPLLVHLARCDTHDVRTEVGLALSRVALSGRSDAQTLVEEGVGAVLLEIMDSLTSADEPAVIEAVLGALALLFDKCVSGLAPPEPRSTQPTPAPTPFEAAARSLFKDALVHRAPGLFTKWCQISAASGSAQARLAVRHAALEALATCLADPHLHASALTVGCTSALVEAARAGLTDVKACLAGAYALANLTVSPDGAAAAFEAGATAALVPLVHLEDLKTGGGSLLTHQQSLINANTSTSAIASEEARRVLPDLPGVLQECAARALYNLSCQPIVLRRLVDAVSGMRSYPRALQSPHDGVRRLAALTLANMAWSGESTHRLVADGGFEQLVQCIAAGAAGSEDPAIRRACFRALAGLAADAVAQRRLSELSHLRAFCQAAARSEDPSERRDALRVVAAVLSDPSRKVFYDEVMSEPGLITMLAGAVAVTTVEELPLCRGAAWGIAHIARQPARHAALVQAGALRAVVTALLSSDEQLQLAGASGVLQFAANGAVHSALVDSGALESCVGVLRSGSPELDAAVCSALSRFTHSPAPSRALVELGVLDPAVAIGSSRSQEAACEAAIRFLSDLTHHRPEERKHLIEAGAAQCLAAFINDNDDMAGDGKAPPRSAVGLPAAHVAALALFLLVGEGAGIGLLGYPEVVKAITTTASVGTGAVRDKAVQALESLMKRCEAEDLAAQLGLQTLLEWFGSGVAVLRDIAGRALERTTAAVINVSSSSSSFSAQAPAASSSSFVSSSSPQRHSVVIPASPAVLDAVSAETLVQMLSADSLTRSALLITIMQTVVSLSETPHNRKMLLAARLPEALVSLVHVAPAEALVSVAHVMRLFACAPDSAIHEQLSSTAGFVAAFFALLSASSASASFTPSQTREVASHVLAALPVMASHTANHSALLVGDNLARLVEAAAAYPAENAAPVLEVFAQLCRAASGQQQQQQQQQQRGQLSASVMTKVAQAWSPSPFNLPVVLQSKACAESLATVLLSLASHPQSHNVAASAETLSLVDQLCGSASSRVQEMAAGTVRALLSRAAPSLLPALRALSVRVLERLIAGSEPAVVLAGLHVLADAQQGGLVVVLPQETVQRLLQVLVSGRAEMQRVAAVALHSLTAEEGNALAVVQAGAQLIVHAASHSADLLVRAYAAGALANLSLSPASAGLAAGLGMDLEVTRGELASEMCGALHITGSGAVASAVATLTPLDALLALAVVLRGSPTACDAAHKLGIVGVLAAALADSRAPALRHPAAVCLALVIDGGEAKPHASVIRTTVASLAVSDPQCQDALLDTVLSLSKDRASSAALLNAGAIDVLIGVMSAPAAPLHRKATLVLLRLVAWDESAVFLSGANGSLEVVGGCLATVAAEFSEGADPQSEAVLAGALSALGRLGRVSASNVGRLLSGTTVLAATVRLLKNDKVGDRVRLAAFELLVGLASSRAKEHLHELLRGGAAGCLDLVVRAHAHEPAFTRTVVELVARLGEASESPSAVVKQFGFGNLAELTRAEDDALRVTACKLLAELDWGDLDVSLVVHTGLASHLVKLIAPGAETPLEVQRAASKILSQISRNKNLTGYIADAGALPVLFGITSTSGGDPRVQSSAALTLVNLSLNESASDLFKKGVLGNLVSLAQQPHDGAEGGGGGGGEDVVGAGALESLVSLLSSNDVVVQRKAAEAIALFSSDEAVKHRIVAAGALGLFNALAYSDDDGVQQSAVVITRNMISGPASRDRFIESGGLAAIFALLTHHAGPEVQKEALVCLHSLLVARPDIADTVMETCDLDGLIAFSQKPATQVVASTVLSLLSHDEGHLTRLFAMGGLPLLTAILKHSSEVPISLIAHAARSSHTHDTLMSSGALLTIISSSLSSNTDEVEAVAVSLFRLACNPHNHGTILSHPGMAETIVYLLKSSRNERVVLAVLAAIIRLTERKVTHGHSSKSAGTNNSLNKGSEHQQRRVWVGSQVAGTLVDLVKRGGRGGHAAAQAIANLVAEEANHSVITELVLKKSLE